MQPQLPAFWEELGISPDRSKRRADFDALCEKARKGVRKLTHIELNRICEESRVTLPKDADRRVLADALLAALPDTDLIGLHLFLKQRMHAVKWAARQNKKLKRCVGNLAAPKPLALLLLAFACDPRILRDIFYYDAWCGTSTSARFLPRDSKTQQKLGEVLNKSAASKLAGFLSKATDLGSSLVGFHKLPSGSKVVLINRHYAPTIAKDYVQEFVVKHGCGLLVLGYSAEDRTLHIKGGNAKLIDGIENFFEHHLHYPLLRTDVQTVSADSYERFREFVILGENSPDELRLVGVCFRRNALTGHPIEIPPGGDTLTISATVQRLHESKFTEGLSLLDIEHFTVAFGSHKNRITTKVLSNGAVILTYDNRGIDGDSQQHFEAAVQSHLGLVLHRQINPLSLPSGQLPVIAALLHSKRLDEIEPFQRALHNPMLQAGLFHLSKRSVLKCTNALCRSRPMSIDTATNDQCQLCGHDLQQNDVDLTEPDRQAIVNLFAVRLAACSEWKVRPTERTFEGVDYLEVTTNNNQMADPSIVLYDAERLTEKTREKLERLGKPIVLLDNSLTKTPVQVDANGIGRVSVPFLILDEIESTETLHAGLPKLLADVTRSYKERVHKAARRSFDCLSGAKCMDGDQYELDVYNLLRVVFPHSVRLGRKRTIEPDGILQITASSRQDDGDISPTMCIGYDAKFNKDGKGYKLPIGERRKVRDYVAEYRRSKKRLGIFREISAHAFVSNNMAEKQVADTVKYLRSKKGMSQDFRCLLITQEFLVAMYELIESQYEEFESRRHHFADLFYNVAVKPGVGYVPFTENDAHLLFNATMERPRISDRITHAEVVAALSEFDCSKIGVPQLTIA